MNPIVIVGAGWAGLSAAVELSAQGHAVSLLETATVSGGRARSVRHAGRTFDNGQHLLLGAYRETRALLDRLGVPEEDVFARMPLELLMHDDAPNGHLHIRAGRLPGRLHLAQGLLGAAGIALPERWRWLRAAHRLRRPPPATSTVSAWLEATAQPPRMRRQVWEPLCLAALNTPARTAAASVFHRVLDEALANRRQSALLIPSRALGRVLPEPAQAYLRAHGADIRHGSRVKHLLVQGGSVSGVALRSGDIIPATTVILACGPWETARLLTPHAETSALAARISRLQALPIVTVYLDYDPEIQMQPAMRGLLDGPLQWVFDRGFGGEPGVIAGVISGPGPHRALDNAALIDAAVRQLNRLFPEWGRPRASWVIREQRATFAATPDAETLRPAPETALKGLWLAGDYLSTGLPATLESAVRSARDCAGSIAASSA
ncbi:hydroxysqualene dehydroxylase HpnE [Acidihalobacter ferrooxydans]|uniref:Amine oxidase domain-containing protein n=1 Tax=Acidihalobacter ferrooxydans TaxID=1765967 RepID=A0A1P8UF85_9GAMM|nr:hydroxysqualene dehydroxylase HpnE [Acidihalobacter ferrooxydans]APZ42451.1 hypothetical protein BW247_04565 [Acidihalobacter ferrooxydans]